MEYSSGVLFIIGICIVVILIGILKKKSHWVINFIMRAFIGMISILVLNKVMEQIGYDIMVGINLLTVLTSGILGFPGVIALYVLQFYHLL